MTWIGKAVRYHRKKSGLTQKELADLAGIGKTAVFDIEHGKQTVQLETLMSVFHVLNIKVTLQSPLMNAWRKEAGYEKV
ncbi:MAG: type II toxin-antitoxin system Y4mF family antitoxin [Balneolaceae bacterium]